MAKIEFLKRNEINDTYEKYLDFTVKSSVWHFKFDDFTHSCIYGDPKTISIHCRTDENNKLVIAFIHIEINKIITALFHVTEIQFSDAERETMTTLTKIESLNEK